MDKRFDKWTPAAAKSWLFAAAGLMWSGVGVYLCGLTFEWLKLVNNGTRIWLIFSGLVLATSLYAFGFSRFADKNIGRISAIPKKVVCIFVFQQWSSYPLVAIMISLGIFLRNYAPISKPWLAVLYIGIGGSLFCEFSLL